MYTHRPCEGERKPDRAVDSFPRRLTPGSRAQHGSDHVSEGARGGGVDLHLVLLQAHPEPWAAGALALGGPSHAALPQVVLSGLVVEGLQPQLEHSGRLRLRQEKRARASACVLNLRTKVLGYFGTGARAIPKDQRKARV